MNSQNNGFNLSMLIDCSNKEFNSNSLICITSDFKLNASVENDLTSAQIVPPLRHSLSTIPPLGFYN